MRTPPSFPRQHTGLQVVGPGFYLWDPDAREALRLAAELSRRPPQLPARRRRALLREPIA